MANVSDPNTVVMNIKVDRDTKKTYQVMASRYHIGLSTWVRAVLDAAVAKERKPTFREE